jgi:ribonuclease P protein component
MLPKKNRLTSIQVEFLLRKGSFFSTGNLKANFIESQNNKSRFAVSVSRKQFKNANTRNLIRRRIYESLREILKSQSFDSPKIDCIVSLRRHFQATNFTSIKKETAYLIKQITSKQCPKENLDSYKKP